MRRLLDTAEDALQRTLDAVHLARSRRAASRWLRSKADLRGLRCHCPPDLPVHLVHSEGLREAADVVVDFGANVQSAVRRQVPVPALAAIAHEIGGGDVVHVKADLLGEFLAHVFPRIAGPIVLVTGDSDYAPVRDHAALLEHPKIVHWFAQNCDRPGRHPRLTRIPIGIDNPRYTKLEKRIGFVVDMAFGKAALDRSATRNDMGEQDRLLAVAATLPALAERPLRVLCTFHMNQKLVPNFDQIPDRREAYELLRGEPACHFVSQRLPQEACWRAHGEFAFELSPRGKGLDCFRTWECLALGAIPIVKRSTLDPLYADEDLPVVIVESFREVNAARLARWRDEHAGRFGDALRRKLSNDYWVERIRAVRARGAAESSTMRPKSILTTRSPASK
jgi:hypothetical protein